MKKIMVLMFSILLFLSLACVPDADAGRLKGYVTNTSGTPLSGVKVKTALGSYVTTNASGYFQFALLCCNVSLTFYLNGYNYAYVNQLALGYYEDRTITTVRMSTVAGDPGGTYCGACMQSGPTAPSNPSH